MFAGTSAHTSRGGQTKFSNFFTVKKKFVGQRGAMADLAKG